MKTFFKFFEDLIASKPWKQVFAVEPGKEAPKAVEVGKKALEAGKEALEAKKKTAEQLQSEFETKTKDAEEKIADFRDNILDQQKKGEAFANIGIDALKQLDQLTAVLQKATVETFSDVINQTLTTMKLTVETFKEVVAKKEETLKKLEEAKAKLDKLRSQKLAFAPLVQAEMGNMPAYIKAAPDMNMTAEQMYQSKLEDAAGRAYQQMLENEANFFKDEETSINEATTTTSLDAVKVDLDASIPRMENPLDNALFKVFFERERDLNKWEDLVLDDKQYADELGKLREFGKFTSPEDQIKFDALLESAGKTAIGPERVRALAQVRDMLESNVDVNPNPNKEQHLYEARLDERETTKALSDTIATSAKNLGAEIEKFAKSPFFEKLKDMGTQLNEYLKKLPPTPPSPLVAGFIEAHRPVLNALKEATEKGKALLTALETQYVENVKKTLDKKVTDLTPEDMNMIRIYASIYKDNPEKISLVYGFDKDGKVNFVNKAAENVISLADMFPGKEGAILRVNDGKKERSAHFDPARGEYFYKNTDGSWGDRAIILTGYKVSVEKGVYEFPPQEIAAREISGKGGKVKPEKKKEVAEEEKKLEFTDAERVKAEIVIYKVANRILTAYENFEPYTGEGVSEEMKIKAYNEFIGICEMEEALLGKYDNILLEDFSKVPENITIKIKKDEKKLRPGFLVQDMKSVILGKEKLSAIIKMRQKFSEKGENLVAEAYKEAIKRGEEAVAAAMEKVAEEKEMIVKKER